MCSLACDMERVIVDLLSTKYYYSVNIFSIMCSTLMVLMCVPIEIGQFRVAYKAKPL